MKRLCALLLVLWVSMPLMADRKLYRYGWEDNPGNPLINDYQDGVTESLDSTTIYGGSSSMKMILNSSSGSYGKQCDICWIQGLVEGDIIKGSFWRYNESATAGCRIDGYYTENDTFDYDYWSGDSSFTDAGIGEADWEMVSFTWVYTEIDSYDQSVHTGFVITSRPYTSTGNICYVDNFEVEVPSYATVTLPGTADEIITIPDVYDPNAVQHRAYGWEDGFADVLGAYGNVYIPANTESPDPVRSGSRSLKLTEYPLDGTPQAYVAMITGLKVGEKVTAGFWAYDDTVGTGSDYYPSVRIWAHSADANDITSYFGSLSGNETYSGETVAGWSRLEYEWTFAASGEEDAMVIEARLYSPMSGVESQDFWIDDVNVIAPETATIIFPEDLYRAEDFAVSNCTWDTFTDPAAEQPVVLGTFGMVNAELDQFTSYDGDNRALLLTDAESDYTMSTLKQAMDRGYEVGYNGFTGEGYLAVIKGLMAGQRVKASFQALSNSSDENAGVRLWAHYIYNENDLYSWAGSADGFDVYSNAAGWTKLAYTWYFDSDSYTDVQGIERTPVALVITGRPFTENGQGGYIDDLDVEAPVTAMVEFPLPTNDPICVGGFPEYDFNLDCKVDLLDLADFSAVWLSSNLQP